jgi:hypothetical protein
MICICGCEEKAVCVIGGMNPKGEDYEMAVCDSFAGYSRECAEFLGLPFERKQLQGTEDSPVTEPQVSEGTGHLEPASIPR